MGVPILKMLSFYNNTGKRVEAKIFHNVRGYE